MNQNIQRLIQSLSPEKLKEINDYVIANMSNEIRQASMYGNLNESMQNDLDNLIIKFLKENYPEDMDHTLKVSEGEVRRKVEDMVANSILQMKNTPLDDHDGQEQTSEDEAQDQVQQPVFNMGGNHSTVTTQKANVNQTTAQPQVVENPIDQTVEDSNSDVMSKNPNQDVLGVNNSYDQLHDNEQRFFGLQSKLYRFLAKFEDEDVESYIRIVLVVATIGMVLGFWSVYSDISTAKALQEFYKHKNSVYMLNLADYCQHTTSQVELFKKCVAARQADVISDRRWGVFKNLLVGIFSLVVFFIVYFLKLNYRGRDAYLEKEND